ncbi:MAG: ABC transporter ATP-binding protein [Candidatus Rokuibacteriota bacterium]
MALLSVRELTVRFGGLRAVDGFSMDVTAGRIHSLIGPNGAGKTSVINAITGLYPAAGSIRLDGRELLGRAPHAIAELGVTRTFQNVELFADMSVLDNVLVGAHRRLRYGVLAGTLQAGPRWRREGQERRRAEEILETVGLADERAREAGDLTFGKQRRLELARALATGPRLLLLDEPAAGMTAAEIGGLNTILLALRAREALTILLVDHVMQVVMEISDTITVLHYGRKIAEGSAERVRTDPEVVRAYLGEGRRRARA